MRRVFVHLCLLLWLVGAAAASAQTFSLTDGTSVSGELISADDRGVVFRTPEGQTLDRVSWIKFSQDSLKTLMKNPKTARYVEPFLDVDVSQKAQKREVNIRELEKPPREAASSFLGGFLGSGFGLLILFLAYGASIYAGYEVAIVRAYPWPLVCGVAAVAPIIGPVVFLCLPTRVVSHADDGDAEWKTYDGGGVMAAEAEAAAAVSDCPEAITPPPS